MKVTTERIGRAVDVGPFLRLAFEKRGGERRFLRVGRSTRIPQDARSLRVGYGLDMEGGQAWLAFYVSFPSGGHWRRKAALPLPADRYEASLPIDVLTPTLYSEATRFEKGAEAVCWVGIVIEGEAKGTFDLSRVVFSSEPHRPTTPVRIPCREGRWSISKDPNAEAAVRFAPGQDGRGETLTFRFTFPGNRHMWGSATTDLRDADLAGYEALRFDCRAHVPKGLRGVLVQVTEEDGSVYYTELTELPHDSWTTVDLALSELKAAPWSQDEDGRLDIGAIRRLSIGSHGQAADARAEGTIAVRKVRFSPR